ncbi:hypothetical protein ACTXT7_015194 [Hymenolepis weldensis]
MKQTPKEATTDAWKSQSGNQAANYCRLLTMVKWIADSYHYRDLLETSSNLKPWKPDDNSANRGGVSRAALLYYLHPSEKKYPEVNKKRLRNTQMWGVRFSYWIHVLITSDDLKTN